MNNTKIKNLHIPPHSIEAEQAVLGGIMIDNTTWEKIADRLNNNDFYEKNHKLIFKAMLALISENKPLDIITISENLEKKNDLEKIGGIKYLSKLAKNTTSTANIIIYSNIIKDRALLRKLITISKDIIDSSLNLKERNVSELIDEAEEKILSLSKDYGLNKNENLNTISSILAITIKKIETLFESNSHITGLSSGFIELDKITSGLQSSDLIIVAGRPSMGKTTLSINIAEYITIKTDNPVLIFSMEMPAEQLAMRILASLGRIELQRLRTGMLKDTDWPRLSSAISLISAKKLFIDDSGSLTPFDIRNKARKIYKKYGKIGTIVIDYLQLMHIPGLNDLRAAEISEISRSLKILAKELKVPIIALSQLNRSLEQRIDKRPIMSDLRESGSIEQDADLIIFIYRDEIYNKNSLDTGTAEIIIAKQRNGPTGTIKLTFLGQYSRFENFTNKI
ncbi:MAG: replicative DNA helicase [Enterobacteriaceae bacterium]|nr:replicative DNA helicase [Enterobacteriaceae bacterium]